MSQTGYVHFEARKGSFPIEVAAATTDQVLTKELGITAESSVRFAMSITVSDVVLGAGEEILIELEEAVAEGMWAKVGSPQGGVLINDGDGAYCIKLDEGVALEALVLPLFDCIRVVVTTGATSSLTIDSINITHRI